MIFRGKYIFPHLNNFSGAKEKKNNKIKEKIRKGNNFLSRYHLGD